jgi:signal transduction histidine kinase
MLPENGKPHKNLSMGIRFKYLILVLLMSHEGIGQHNHEKKYFLFKAKYDSLSKLTRSYANDTLRLMTLDSIMGLTVKMKSTELYAAYKKIAYESKWKKGIARYKMHYGSYQVDKTPVLGVQFLIEAEKELEILNDYPSQIFTLLRISMALTHKTDSLSSLNYLDKAIRISKKINNQDWLLRTLSNKGDYYLKRENIETALAIFEEIDSFGSNNSRTSIINDLNIGFCYLKTNQVNKALKYYTRSFKKMKTDIKAYAGFNIEGLFDITTFFLQNAKDYSTAKKYFLEIEPLLKINLNDNTTNFRYNDLGYGIYKELGKSNQALEFLEQKYKFSDSLSKDALRNGQEGIKSELALKEQTEKLQKAELDKIKIENERQNQLRWIFLILSITGFVSTLYVFKINRKLKLNNKSLLDHNKEISKALLKGQTIERQRVAADLHDNLGSTLSALWLSLDAINQTNMNQEEKAIHQNLRENLEKAYNDVRLLSHNLLPEEFEKQGLTSILQGFVRKMNKNSKIKFDLKIDEDFGRVDNKIEFELYSICLELVNNIIKHSKATEAKILLSRNEKQIELIISDNGIGTFNNESDGKGMKNVKARVESLNGVWEFKNRENEGFVNTIKISV